MKNNSMKSLDTLERNQQLADPQTGAVPLTAASTTQLLDELLASAGHGTFAFDLDSTLLNNRPRNAVIMSDFGVQQNEPLLASATAEHFTEWSARKAMLKTGLPITTVKRLLDPYLVYWSERFFSSEYCQHDTGIPGASEFVTSVRDHGGTICYLTGRDEGMRAGTQSSLEKLGFPIPGSDGVRLLMKPDKDHSDDLFKAETLQKLAATGPVCAAFDNEPTHINSYRTAFPNAVCVHLLTDHSMRDVKLLANIVSISNFVR